LLIALVLVEVLVLFQLARSGQKFVAVKIWFRSGLGPKFLVEDGSEPFLLYISMKKMLACSLSQFV